MFQYCKTSSPKTSEFSSFDSILIDFHYCIMFLGVKTDFRLCSRSIRIRLFNNNNSNTIGIMLFSLCSRLHESLCQKCFMAYHSCVSNSIYIICFGGSRKLSTISYNPWKHLSWYEVIAHLVGSKRTKACMICLV